MVMYLELLAELSDHFVIEIGTIIRNDSFRDSVSKDQIMPDETCYDALGYRGVGSCLNPLREVIDRHQDEAMPIGDVITVGEREG